MSHIEKLLILDGISGIPMGREICSTFHEKGIATEHFDCLQTPRRPFHGIRSAYSKLRARAHEKDSFHFLPKLSQSTLQELITRVRPSHILVIGFIYKFFDPQQLRQLAQKSGASLHLYDTDTCNLYSRRREFIFFIQNELPVYDKVFSCSAVTTRFFRDTCELNAEFVPFGANPINSTNGTQDIDALFVGSCDLRRIFLLEGIRDHVSVRGNRWQRNMPLISGALRQRVDDRPVWGNELHQLLGRAKIVLNITRTDFYGAETGINLRIFEALAAGRFLLTDHCDELETLFVIGEEVETFRSSRELVEKVAYYLENGDARSAIARRGKESFLLNHTWHTRIERKILPLLTSP